MSKPLIKAIDRLREYMAAGQYRKALQLAASWPRLGEHKEAIEQGWAAASNPDFYREIGKDPEELEARGIAAIRERYNIQPPMTEQF